MSNSEFYPIPSNADDRIHIYRTLKRLRYSLFHVQAILATLAYDPDLELHHRTDVFRLSQFAQNWEEQLNSTDATGELKQFQRREADRARGLGSCRIRAVVQSGVGVTR